MPELPEVETIRRDLTKKVLNKKIVQCEVLLKRIVKNNLSNFLQAVKGDSFKKIERIGKLLIFRFKKSNKILLIHLKMTGQLIYIQGKEIIAGGHSEKENDFNLPNRHTRVIFEFNNKGRLYFNDLRTFGYLKLVTEQELGAVRKNFGVEPLADSFNERFLISLLKTRKTNIKAVLLNQKLISGIGNIYADEILFASGVLPTRLASTIKEKEIKRIVKNAKLILKKAIKHRGTTFNNYVDAEGNKGNFVRLLKVYGRAGKKCYRCKELIQKKKVVGRGTHYCKKCQT